MKAPKDSGSISIGVKFYITVHQTDHFLCSFFHFLFFRTSVETDPHSKMDWSAKKGKHTTIMKDKKCMISQSQMEQYDVIV